VQYLSGHGTHVTSTIAAPINGMGIAGAATQATLTSLKACSEAVYCSADSVAAALWYAGDQQLDIFSLNLFADAWQATNRPTCSIPAGTTWALTGLRAVRRSAECRTTAGWLRLSCPGC
jgi:subtilisin family serine protease